MVTAGPPTTTPEPSRRLAPAARIVWRVEGAIATLLALVPAVLVARFAGGGWAPLAWGALALVALSAIGAVPELRWRRWRWEVREHEIDLQRGILVVRRTLIPMARVQHVETERGVIGQALGLSTVEIHTAAGSHEIPLLRDGDAGAIRTRIAELARTDADEIARADADEIARADTGEITGTDDG